MARAVRLDPSCAPRPPRSRRAARRRERESKRRPGPPDLEACAPSARSLRDGLRRGRAARRRTLGLAATLEAPTVWHCTRTPRSAEPDALARAMELAERCSAGARARTSRSSPGAAAAARRPPPRHPARHRPARRRATCELEPRLPGRVVRPLGVDLDRPFCLQVLELDRWDDPHAAIEAFRLAQAEEPGPPARARRAPRPRRGRGLAGGEGDLRLRRGQDGVLLLTTYEGLGSLEVGRAPAAGARRRSSGRSARGSTSPRSRRSGSGRRWWVGRGGFRSPSATAWTASSRPRPSRRRRTSWSWSAIPGLAVEMGRAGRERVRERFLVTRGARARAARAAQVASKLDEGLPPRRHRARARGRRHRRRRRRARSARVWRGRRSGCKVRTATCATSTRRSRTAPGSRSSPPQRRGRPSWLIRHDAAHVLATAVMELYPGVKISIGPPIEDGFYYDFEFPEGVEGLGGRLRAHRGQDARAHQGRRALRAHRRAGRPTAIERFSAEGQDYKVELIEDLVRRPGRRDRLALPERPLHRPLPRPARRPARSDIKAFKLTTRGRRLLARRRRAARCSPASTAPPSSRRSDLEEHLKRLEEARARDHRKLGRELGLFMLSELSPGVAVLAAARHAHLERADQAVADHQRRARLHRGAHADPLRRRALEAVRPLGRLPRPHVLHGRGGPADGPQAHELPRARADLQARPALVPRPADPLRRAGPGPPPRAERHAPRPAARPPHHPGRRARVLHARSRSRRRSLRCLDFGFYIYDQFGFKPRLRAVHAARQARRHRRDVGPGRGGADGRRSRTNGLEYDLQRGRRRLLRPEDRPPHDRRDRPLLAARHRAARLLHAGAFELDLHGRGQRRAPPGDDPPRADGLVRALHRHPDRALRRASSRSGWRPCRRACCRSRTGTSDYAREVAEPSCDAAACAWRWTSAPSRSARRSARRELHKVPYMLVVGDKEARDRRRWRCGATARATWAHWRSSEFAERLVHEIADRRYTSPANDVPIHLRRFDGRRDSLT